MDKQYIFSALMELTVYSERQREKESVCERKRSVKHKNGFEDKGKSV